MPAAEYEHRSDSVLAWKKAQKLGRFDPEAPSIEQQKIRASEREVEERGKRYLFLPVPACQVVRLWQREQQKQIKSSQNMLVSMPHCPAVGIDMQPRIASNKSQKWKPGMPRNSEDPYHALAEQDRSTMYHLTFTNQQNTRDSSNLSILSIRLPRTS